MYGERLLKEEKRDCRWLARYTVVDFDCISCNLVSCNKVVTKTSTKHRRRKGSVVGRHHGECGARAYNGFWGRAPSGVQGQSPSPPEAESIFDHWMSNGADRFSPFICITTLGATVMIWKKNYVKIQGVT